MWMKQSVDHHLQPSDMAHELAELEDLARLASAVPRDSLGLVADSPPVAPVAAAPLPRLVGPEGEDLAELQQLIQHVEPPPSFPRRSAELLAHARKVKAKRRADGELEAAVVKRQAAETKLAVVNIMSPSLSRSLCIKSNNRVVDASALSLVRLKLACSPRAKGSHLGSQAKTQNRCARQVAACLLQLQADYVQRSAVPDGPLVLGAAPERVLCCSVQWDETSQKLRPIWRALPVGARASHLQCGAQVMVLSGGIHLGTQSSDGHFHLESHAWHVKPLRLEQQSADYLLEALFRSLPLHIDDPELLSDIERHNTAFLIVIGVDRASPNTSACNWLCDWLYHARQQRRCLLHAEPCGVHGCALVKGRSSALKRISSALYSFTRWVRIGRNLQSLSEGLSYTVSQRLVVRETARHPAGKTRSLSIIKAIYGDLTSEYLWRESKRTGDKEKTTLLLDLEALCEVINLGEKELVFYNRIGDDDAGGGEIYGSRQECVDAVLVPLLNLLASKAWVTSSESRWTNVGTTLRRFLTGTIACRCLPLGLGSARASLQLADDMEEALAKVVAADKDGRGEKQVALVKLLMWLSFP